jgi:hypothetical protein
LDTCWVGNWHILRDIGVTAGVYPLAFGDEVLAASRTIKTIFHTTLRTDYITHPIMVI